MELNETLERTSIQALREFLLHGTNEEIYSDESYRTRINRVSEEWEAFAAELDPDATNRKLYSTISTLLTEYEHVYMEIGIQAGFKLARELGIGAENVGDSPLNKALVGSVFLDILRAMEMLQHARLKAEQLYL